MVIEGNKLRPDNGYKYITNGNVYSDLVFLGRSDSIDNWRDTNDEPPAPEENEITPEELAVELEAML